MQRTWPGRCGRAGGQGRRNPRYAALMRCSQAPHTPLQSASSHSCLATMRRAQSSKSLWRRRTRATVLSTFRTMATPCPTRTRSEPSYVWELVEVGKQATLNLSLPTLATGGRRSGSRRTAYATKTRMVSHSSSGTTTKGSGARETWSAPTTRDPVSKSE